MMDLPTLRAEYAARLASLFSELYTLPAAPEMAAQHADIVHTIDARCVAYREILRQTRPGMRPA